MTFKPQIVVEWHPDDGHMILLPNDTIEFALTRMGAERIARAWLKRHPSQTRIGGGVIEWREQR